MKNNAKIIGMMIRKYRLEQNMSQEALCQGICAVSYLSKIEKGSVLSSDEILSRLFDVLGISVPDNSQALEIYGEKINDYFSHFFFLNSQEAEAIMTELRPKRDVLLHSYLAIDMMLVEAYDEYYRHKGKNDLKSQLLILLQYEDYMDNLQAHRMYMLLGFFEIHINHNYRSGLDYYKLAQNRKNDGIVLESLSYAHYLIGDYLESITLGDEAYSKLMEEGYVERAISLCFVIAAAYSNYKNINKTLQYYNRILALNNLTKYQSQRVQVYYNIGSTYLATRDYIKALHNLEKSYELSKDQNEDSISYLLLLQKLFLAHMGLDQRDEAKVYLNLSTDFYDSISENQINHSLRVSLDWMKIMYNNQNYLQDENYLNSVKILYDASLKDSHHGFHRFYGNYLIEAYKSHRKYKEALKVTEALYVKSRFS